MGESDIVGQVRSALERTTQGDKTAFDAVLPLINDELRSLAERYLARERRDHTLQATALVNEAYLRLLGQANLDPRNRAHLLAAMATTIRRVLVDHARGRNRRKRGGEFERVALDGSQILAPEQNQSGIDSELLDAALDRLAELNPRSARIVELRFFGGLTEEQAAEELGITDRTVRKDWNFAKAWLRRELENGE